MRTSKSPELGSSWQGVGPEPAGWFSPESGGGRDQAQGRRCSW
jgi:hypothetical protein